MAFKAYSRISVTTQSLISNATDSPLPVGEGREARRRRLGVRSLSMFTAGVEILEGLALSLVEG